MSQSGENITATVIIPAYKAVDTLAKAIESAQAQTLPGIEIIVVDDCSPDATADVAERMAAADSRVRVLRLPQNRHKPFAMNIATAQAKGKWIAVLDADDWYAPDRLEHLIHLAETEKVDMVADNQVFIDEATRVAIGTAFPPGLAAQRITFDEFLANSDPKRSFDLGMLKPIFRTQFIRDNAIDYHECAKNGHDFYVLLSFFAAGGKAILSSRALYFYVKPIRGKNYDFALMKKINDHFIKDLGPRLTSLQIRQLERRGQGFEAVLHLRQLRQSLQEGKVTAATWLFLRHPALLSHLSVGRVYQKLSLFLRHPALLSHLSVERVCQQTAQVHSVMVANTRQRSTRERESGQYVDRDRDK